MTQPDVRSRSSSAEREELIRLARQRLQTVVLEAETTTLDSIMQRLFDRDHRELLTYSAFGSAL